MDKLKIYSGSQLKEMGIRLARLENNRAVNEGAVKKKAASIKKTGILCPSIIIEAKKCLDQGLKVFLYDKAEVTTETEGLDNIYVLLEGQHRDRAIQELNASLVEGEEPYENFYMTALSDKASIAEILREANTTTFPWKDKDYLGNLLQAKKGQNLELLEEIKCHPKASTKAAIHYLKLNAEVNLYSRSIVSAMTDDKKLEAIKAVDPARLELGKKLFNTITAVLGEEEAGKVVYPDWCIALIEKNTDIPLAKMVEVLCNFFKGIKEIDRNDLKATRRDSKLNISRDEQLKEKLNKLYAGFETKNQDKDGYREFPETA